MSEDVVNVQPHGRILSILGDIEFSQWQCLAELVDNAFDDFLAHPQDGERPTVSISLPSRHSDARMAEVWVTDNGRGMDLTTLGNAVSAGWSGNARYGSLGLYGMGFNVATARLGRVATVRTTRVGDPSWTVLVLDLDVLGRGKDYDVVVRYERKDDPQEHGTQVVISSLKNDQWDKLSRQANKIRDELGDVYSYLLRERDFIITVNGTKVRARRPCVWDESRSVTRSGATIPAIIRIDQPLAPMKACMDCGWWNRADAEECADCRKTDLEIRERRIWGWIGVQRYLHKSDYGIDFLRNGRKILIRDKRLFYWEDPNGLDAPDPEYPIDSRRGRGRFVGEIHCDHVPVNYQKNAFEYDNPEWRTIVRVVRGESPLREKIAEKLGFHRNTSYLARLYAGFRREDPGLKYLVPGDGKQALFDKALQWAELFRKDDPEYLTDGVWYQAAWQHDNPIAPQPDAEPGDVFEEMGLGGAEPDDSDVRSRPSGPSARNDPAPDPGETLDERLARYRESATPLVDLAGRYEASALGHVELSVWVVGAKSLADAAGNDVPVFTQMVRAPRLEAFVAIEHPMFVEYGMDPRDLVMIEVAEFLRVRGTGTSREPKPLSAVLADLKSRATDQKVTSDVLANRAGHLLDRIRDAMQTEVKGAPAGYWDLLQESERVAAQRRFAIEGGDALWGSVVESGEFTLFLPAGALVRLIERRPESFLDGKVFRRVYASLSDDDSRSLVVSRLIGFVGDLALMDEHHPRLGLTELQRVRLSCLLVEADLTDRG